MTFQTLRTPLCAALALSLTGACAQDEVPEQQALAVDEDGDGLCDNLGSEDPPPPPAVPTRVSTPSSVSLSISLASDIDAPAAGRLALVAFLPDPSGATVADFHEFGSVDLGALPQSIDFTIPEAPAALLQMKRDALEDDLANAPYPVPDPDDIEVFLGASLVVYDDANGNGVADYGEDYGPIGYGADFNEAARSQWFDTYGGVDFMAWSSPSDPDNELLSLTPLRASFGEDGTVALTVSERSCVFHETDEGGCAACTASSAPLNGAVSLEIDWQLGQ